MPIGYRMTHRTMNLSEEGDEEQVQDRGARKRSHTHSRWMFPSISRI